ncbi:hypothetical protein M0804_005437 [Polistes exclamans]|nr:hypothetical protein M0804_005437 [Polistes exclamans]
MRDRGRNKVGWVGWGDGLGRRKEVKTRRFSSSEDYSEVGVQGEERWNEEDRSCNSGDADADADAHGDGGWWLVVGSSGRLHKAGSLVIGEDLATFALSALSEFPPAFTPFLFLSLPCSLSFFNKRDNVKSA